MCRHEPPLISITWRPGVVISENTVFAMHVQERYTTFRQIEVLGAEAENEPLPSSDFNEATNTITISAENLIQIGSVVCEIRSGKNQKSLDAFIQADGFIRQNMVWRFIVQAVFTAGLT